MSSTAFTGPHTSTGNQQAIEAAFNCTVEIDLSDHRDGASQYFVDSLPDVINNFRYPSGQRYRELEGSERAAIKSVESQVQRVEQVLCEWVTDIVGEAVEVGFDEEDSAYIDNRGQVQDLCTRAKSTQILHAYRAKDYPGTVDDTGDLVNDSGRYVDWASRRAIRAPINEAVAEILGRKSPGRAANANQLVTDLSAVARNPAVRRKAYDSRMNAKIGLACMRVFTPVRTQILGEYFIFERDEAVQHSATVDLMDKFRDQQAAVARLHLPATENWDPVNLRQEECIPF